MLPAPAVFIPVPPVNVTACVLPPAAPESVETLLRTSSSRDTAPADTLKSAVANDATPLLLVDASSPAIVIVDPAAEVSIPSPPAKVSV